MSTIQTILHPTDFSPECNYAFKVACSLAKDYNARLVLLHVMRPSVAPVFEATVPSSLEPVESQIDLLGRFPWPQPTDPNLQVDHRVTEGDPADEIVHLAQAIHCDLIVMGTHGRTGLNRLLTGSVAEEVLRRAVCPVMTIRQSPAEATSVPVTPRPLAKPGEVVDARPLGNALLSTPTRKLAASNGIEILHLILPAGKELFEFRSRGTSVAHCLEGRVAVIAFGKTQILEPGRLMYLPKDEPRTLKGVEDSSLLLTTMVPHP
jgi:nucleotide-binding universal stress UspA family protein/quercetin dioxygenase-like cupin family protein